MTTIYARGKTYWLRDGKHRESLKTKNKELAKLRAKDYESEKLRPKGTLKLEAAIERYLAHVKPSNKPVHFSDKKRILQKFLAISGNVLLHAVGEEQVTKYLGTRESLSPYRWNTERQTISALLNWAIARNFYRDANPVKLVLKKKEPRGKAADILTNAQIKKVRLIVKHNRDMEDAFLVALNGGFRVQEIENQQWDDFQLEHEGTKVQAHADGWCPKDYEARFVPLNHLALRIYRRRQKEQALSPFIFPNAKGGRHEKDWVTAMSRAMRRAGIAHGGWHRTRHTFATRAVENGMDLESIRIIMGISDTKTLLKYVHVSDDYRERVRKRLPRIG